jgi:hypothetical protein
MRVGLILLLITTAVAGCFTASPNLLSVQRPGITARGTISKQEERIELIDIDLRQLPETQIHEISIALTPTNQATLAEITEDAVQEISTPSTVYYSAPSTGITYFVSGYSIRFEGGRLVTITASRYGFPAKNTAAYVKFSSHVNRHSLTLPCSVAEFEDVFGKADKITKGFSW